MMGGEYRMMACNVRVQKGRFLGNKRGIVKSESGVIALKKERLASCEGFPYQEDVSFHFRSFGGWP